MMLTKMNKYHTHIPVLLEESIDLLVTETTGIYVDATLGGGGHTKELLNRLDTSGKVFGLDQDKEALKSVEEKIDDQRLHTILGNFGYISTLLPVDIKKSISGILFDLGVSTHQIREPERGFSFQEDGPLDMRMSELSGVSAYQIVNEYSYEKLRDIIFHYGEERLSRQIARSIISKRPLETTLQLRDAITEVVHGRYTQKSLARVFQAIRIEVNRELEMLKSALKESLQLLKPGGRIVAISYHSLEDRIVKRFFRSGNLEGQIKKDFYGNIIRPLKPVLSKVITPSEEEIRLNPASRSARLRAAEITKSEGA